MINLGLSRHIDKIHAMMQRANRDDGWIDEAFSQSYSLEDLSGEILDEMESDKNCKKCKDCKCVKHEQTT
jgi:hypothetical protein